MITRLWNLVQLSIYSTRGLFHKYFVATKYRGICQFLDMSESPSLMQLYSCSSKFKYICKYSSK